ncbi:MAG: DUF1194 domain-containing protein [Rhodobacteraceae bacterium]|nr:DUF1194 domain-containing protein [Paracoccaceae bacterium]
MGLNGKYRSLVNATLLNWARATGLALAGCLLASAAAGQCRQALALGLDVSGSVDADEYQLQLRGLAGALQSETVRERLLSRLQAPVYLTVYEWSGPHNQSLILGWTAIDSAAALDRATAQIIAANRARSSPTTALGAAMSAGLTLLADLPDCWQHTLDISGDGRSNTGPLPQSIDTSGLPNITINGLVIGNGASNSTGLADLDAYYRAYVIRGPGAFTEISASHATFQEVMERKLLRELTSLAIGQTDLPPEPSL